MMTLGSRALLAQVRGGKGPLDAGELSGLLADHVHTSTELARALDAALGSRAQGLVARSGENAQQAVEWLKQRKQGQVRVIFPGGLEGFKPRPAPEFDAQQRAQVLVRLCDEVSAQAEFELLARYLVGDVFVAVDLSACLSLARAFPTWRFATREGDLVDAAGLVGGHREIAQGAVGRRSSAEALEKSLASLALRIGELEVQERSALARRDELLALRSGSERVFEECRVAMSEAERESHTARARLSDLEAGLALARREFDTVGAEAARLDHDIAAAKERMIQAESSFGVLNQELSTLERGRHELEGQRDLLVRDEQVLSVECARLRAELEGQTERRADLSRGIEELELELQRSQRLAREHAHSADEAAGEIARLVLESDAVLVARAQHEENLARLRSEERNAREAIEAFRRRLDSATRELESVSDQLATLRLSQQRITLDRAEALARAQEDLGLDEFGLAQTWDSSAGEELALHADQLHELEQQVSTLKQELDRIGPVNTEAMEELSEADGRFTFLDEQRKDLQRARLSLSETLATINEESVRLFLSTFEEVRGHFQQLFRQLFGGGKADLELQQGVDPLEAGIEISARPPGREMLPIGLLSGGQRTMTALALLFAVFQARPSPFCILDEVDAALDDANVGRFLGMLDTFRRDTQFVIVTHNKGSMAACDGLYGITMEVKGVSRYVAVEFGEVELIAPHATGNADLASRSRVEVRSRGRAPSSEEGSEQRFSSDGSGDDEADGEREVVLEVQARASQGSSVADKLLATTPEQ
jgi:chromosome segregation protein